MIGYALYILIEVVEARERTQSQVRKIVERTASLFRQSCIIKVLRLLVGEPRLEATNSGLFAAWRAR